MRANPPNQTYLWTLFRSHLEPTVGFGHLAELVGWLDCQKLPGIAPPSWIVEVCLEEGDADHWGYVHDLGGPQEWKIVIAPSYRA